jgi:Ca-activated chloride channel family protein
VCQQNRPWNHQPASAQGHSLEKTTDLVLIPVTVADNDNHPVRGLAKNDFHVFEGGVMQTITHFSSEDVPISLGVLFDTSGSMAPKMEKARKAIVEFFKTSNPLDEMFVITFAYKVRLLQDFTSDIGLIQKHLATVPATGRSAAHTLSGRELRHRTNGFTPIPKL